ncbi:serine hydrolase domain-containing protein [Candidatus Latescibacterota bacterium]
MNYCKISLFVIPVIFLMVSVPHSHSKVLSTDSGIPISSTVENNTFNDVREKMIEMVRKGESPSFSVAVSKGGKVIWEEFFGWADREKEIPATSQSMYSIASTTKPMTATGLMILKERGQVDLSKPANTYIAPAQLKAYESEDSCATVKHILTHTSGLPMHYKYYYEDEPYREPGMAESIRRYGILVQPPGEYFEYANFGYGILDFIIEKVSGQTYPEFMKKEVFLPLGMTHSSVHIDPALEKYAATRYDEDNAPVPFYDFDHDGASAVFCSTPDLLRFGMFHMKDRLPDQSPILEDASIDEMQKITDIKAACWSEETDSGYTLGWMVNKYKGYKTVSHNGGMVGVTSSLMLIPSESIAIVIVTNCLNFNTYGLPYEILNNLLPVKEEEKELAQKQSETEPEKPYNDMIGTWEGKIITYESEVPIKMEFQEDGDVHVIMNREKPDDPINLETILSDFNYNDGAMTGKFYGNVETGDTKIYPHNIHVSMKLKENRLVGYALVFSTTKKVHGGLPSYISLTKSES